MRVTRCVEHNAPMVPRRCGALRSPSPPMKSLPSLAALSLLAACSASARTVPVVVQPSLPARTVRGTVRYEARRPTPTGASREGELRPARFVTLTALDVGAKPQTPNPKPQTPFCNYVPHNATSAKKRVK